MSDDKAIGFTINTGGNTYELVENYSSWSVYDNHTEIFEGGYRRALQIVLNRIGYGDINQGLIPKYCVLPIVFSG